MKAILGGEIFYNGKFEKNACLIYDKFTSKIISLEQYDNKQIEEEIILTDEIVLPGFIDVHIHGGEGYDTMQANYESIEKISLNLAKNGVTSFLPTTMSKSIEDIENSLMNIRKYMNTRNENGAKLLGVHLEGPFLSKEKRGAHDEDCIIEIDEDLIDNNADVIKIISLAPEKKGALELAAKYKHLINFSVAHTNADYQTAKEAIKSGFSSFTHLFNAMSAMTHRELGSVGAALLDDDTYVELICDNIHVHSDLYNLVLRTKSEKKIMLITDCISVGGLPDGRHEIDGQIFDLKNGLCTLQDGTIAGSILQYNTGLKNFIRSTNSDLSILSYISSINQSKFLRLEKIGEIKTGNFADYVILDRDLNVKYTVINGKTVYS